MATLSTCGRLVGAGAGAYAGNQLGHSSDKDAAMSGGAVAGGLLGHAVTGQLAINWERMVWTRK